MTLKELRLSKNLTQAEAAKILGVTRKTYYSYEQGSIDESSLKYKYIVNALEQVGLLDEEHGILTLEQIKSICGEVFKDIKSSIAIFSVPMRKAKPPKKAM